ncbi:Clan SF, family S26, signal peptidase I-like serine peptidase [Tritrichomonas foetus]|uniref:Signal peptidase complex catalytic subunit SEC11 n=1 Tax=Tritrichomonas foetus TaxID=1144522 RepID=A0A1J4L566_9EUKA|nr:Clan SF, family S26, signal peptidase I-like serine peptidase [Tritrichomonas foetus]|eukprot:OHT17077.1 Clan SF, family S26, signal peptidase I-like serine peptidase [Tritrichomonas foetus]
MPKKESALRRFFFGDGIHSSFLSLFRRIVSVANMVLSSALIWMIFVLIFRNNMPLVVVLSDSMKPDFQRGDLLLATGQTWKHVFPIGQVCAYNIKTSPVPIVHRMIETHVSGNSKLILTKGDNNPEPDNWLYRGEEFYFNDKVETKLEGVLPFVGWISILVKEDKRVSILFIAFLIYTSFRNPD